MQGVNCVVVGEIGLDHVRARQDKGYNKQLEVLARACRLAREVGKHVVIHCRGTTSTTNEFLWIMKDNLNETEGMAREVDASFPNVVFGVTLSILKEQLGDHLPYRI